MNRGWRHTFAADTEYTRAGFDSDPGFISGCISHLFCSISAHQAEGEESSPPNGKVGSDKALISGAALFGHVLTVAVCRRCAAENKPSKSYCALGSGKNKYPGYFSWEITPITAAAAAGARVFPPVKEEKGEKYILGKPNYPHLTSL